MQGMPAMKDLWQMHFNAGQCSAHGFQ
jgi:hypothetical protein